MKLFRTLCLLVTPLFVAACGSIAPAPVNAPGIVVGPNESRMCGQGKVLFPAGLYQVEVVSAKGTYYLAPEHLRTAGVLLGRSERGGIFVSNEPGNPQAAWFGNVHENVEERPKTMFAAIGVSAAKRWPYTPRIPFQVKK